MTEIKGKNWIKEPEQGNADDLSQVRETRTGR